PSEYHLHNVHGGIICNPMAMFKRRDNAHLGERFADLRSATVDNHDMNADVAKQAHILGKRNFEVLVDHRMASILDDENSPLKPLNVGEGFVEDGGFLNQFVHG